MYIALRYYFIKQNFNHRQFNMKTIFTFFFAIVCFAAFSQVAPRKVNTVYVEGLGSGINYSLNYDRMFRSDKKYPMSFNVGIAMYARDHAVELVLPVGVQSLIGRNNHFFELGLNLVPYSYSYKHSYEQNYQKYENGVYTDHIGMVTTKDNKFYLMLNPKIGYRYQPTAGGLFVRVTFTPFFGILKNYHTTLHAEDGYLIQEYKGTDPYKTPFFFDAHAFPWGGVSLGWTF